MFKCALIWLRIHKRLFASRSAPETRGPARSHTRTRTITIQNYAANRFVEKFNAENWGTSFACCVCKNVQLIRPAPQQLESCSKVPQYSDFFIIFMLLIVLDILTVKRTLILAQFQSQHRVGPYSAASRSVVLCELPLISRVGAPALLPG